MRATDPAPQVQPAANSRSDHGSRAQISLANRLDYIWIVAAWFALLGGLGEVAGVGVSKFVIGRYVHRDLNAVWMAPLANLLIFAIPALALHLVARRWPGRISPSTAVLPFAFLGYLDVLLVITQLHRYAALLLAAGLAVQTARLAGAHPRAFFMLLRYTLGWIGVFRRRPEPGTPQPAATAAAFSLSRRQFLFSFGATFAGLAGGVWGWQALAERRARAQLPPAGHDVPSVLLIVLDTVRAPSLSLHGYRRRTSPQLDRLAGRGVRFERAVSTAPWTLPSHASMFTGRFPYELAAGWERPLDSAYPTLAEVLSAHGYLTAGFVANTHYCSVESGLARGFVHFEDFPIGLDEIINNTALARPAFQDSGVRRMLDNFQRPGRKSAADLNGEFLRWLAGHNQERPYFAFLNYYDAHHPYLPPKPYDTLFGHKPRVDPWLSREGTWSPEAIQAEQDAYDGSLAYLDHQLGLLFDELEQRGRLENTLVIITSDHGEEFYEHGLTSHGNSLYLPLLLVPLLILFPARVPAGVCVPDPVSLRDLAATVLDLAGVDPGAVLPGRSWARLWQPAADRLSTRADLLLSELSYAPNLSAETPVSKGPMKSLIGGRHHFIQNGDGREELYDFEADPLERRDLAGVEAGRRAAEDFRASLKLILEGGG